MISLAHARPRAKIDSVTTAKAISPPISSPTTVTSGIRMFH